jgi:hypothetical protein
MSSTILKLNPYGFLFVCRFCPNDLVSYARNEKGNHLSSCLSTLGIKKTPKQYDLSSFSESFKGISSGLSVSKNSKSDSSPKSAAT